MRRGFTLIELLVVVGILAVLAAILFPVFARAREKARQASCLSNVRQLLVGLHMYASDNDDFLPRHCPCCPHYTGTAPNLVYFHGCWAAQIYPYVKNSQVFACPSARDSPMSGQLSAAGGNFPAVSRGYGFNLGLDYRLMGQVRFPADCFALADSNNYDGTDPTRDCCPTGFIGPTPRGPGCCAVKAPFGHVSQRHNEGANVGYVDGHAKWLKFSEAAFGNTSTTRNWQPSG